MNVEKYKSRERIRIVTKHIKELTDEFQHIKTDDSVLLQKYNELERVFETLLDEEANYRCSLL